MVIFLCLMLIDPVEIRELVYRAEVYGEVDASLSRLRAGLAETDVPSDRDRLVRAMAIIKKPSRRVSLSRDERGLPELLAAPNAFVNHQGISYLLVEGTWLEPGDWIEDYFVLRIEPDGIEMESLLGHPRPLPFDAFGVPDGATGVMVLREASLPAVLSFASRQAGLSFFIDLRLTQTVSGTHALEDWIRLLSRLCEVYSVSLSLRGENAMFHRIESLERGNGARLSGQDERSEDLYQFLRRIADRLQMELLFDDDLSGQVVYSQYEDQPWDQILECVAITHGFSWSLAEDRGERTTLIVQKQ